MFDSSTTPGTPNETPIIQPNELSCMRTCKIPAYAWKDEVGSAALEIVWLRFLWLSGLWILVIEGIWVCKLCKTKAMTRLSNRYISQSILACRHSECPPPYVLSFLYPSFPRHEYTWLTGSRGVAYNIDNTMIALVSKRAFWSVNVSCPTVSCTNNHHNLW